MRDLTDVDPDLASLVRERLDARLPRLPARFVPPPERPVRRRWVAAVAVAAFLLGVGVAVLLRPAVSSTVLSGVLGRQPAATPTPVVPASSPRGVVPGGRAQPSGSSQTGSSPSPTPEAGPSQATAGGAPQVAVPAVPAPPATPAPQQSAPVVIQVSLPPLPLPTPTPRPSSTPCILGIVCIK